MSWPYQQLQQERSLAPPGNLGPPSVSQYYPLYYAPIQVLPDEGEDNDVIFTNSCSKNVALLLQVLSDLPLWAREHFANMVRL